MGIGVCDIFNASGVKVVLRVDVREQFMIMREAFHHCLVILSKGIGKKVMLFKN